MLLLRNVLISTAKNDKLLGRIRNAHTLPNLPYEYSALEPHISAEIMELHHTKHHAAYVNGLNDTEEKMREAINKSDFAEIICLGKNMKFFGGGHLNHCLFWENLSPCSEEPSSELHCAINTDFMCLENMKDSMNRIACSLQGSGWVWLAFNPTNKKLQLAETQNQDPLQPTQGLVPLLGMDVWEHAYYSQYKNAKGEYIRAIWNVINWKTVSQRYECAIKNSNQ